MDSTSLKKEMQLSIIQSMEHLPPQIILKGLSTYKLFFGNDSFFKNYALSASQISPQVSLICLNCSDNYVDEFLSRQLYSNLEVVRTLPEDSFEDIIQYINTTDSKYLCFCEPNHQYDSSKILDMVSFFEQTPSIDLMIAPRNFIDSFATVIASDGLPSSNSDEDCIFDGRHLLQNSINNNINMYGNLSTLIVSALYAKKISYDIPTPSINAISSLSFLFHLLVHGKGRRMYVPTNIVSTILQPYEDDTSQKNAYRDFVNLFSLKHAITLSSKRTDQFSFRQSSSIAKEITFFYTDMGEYYNIQPIADAAAKRGYKIEFSQNITQKAEIGIYCQHGGHPENSKFSVVLLHDLAQRHDCWPNIWNLEHWNQFDLGIVPGKFWASLWTQCACLYYANPRYGTYEFGYPKSDFIASPALKQRAKILRTRLNLKYKLSILYAPSWENDGKEDDFIRALSSLQVNLLIKQAHWPEQYQSIINNIKQMRAMHEYKYDNVYYIDPTESILTALELCDLVVSEESSVMAEALMFHKPSIAITDWPMPDGNSTRIASMPVDYIVKCKKTELKDYVEKFYNNPFCYDEVLKKGEFLFSNQGHVCEDILDAIEYFTYQKTDCGFLRKQLTPKYTTCSMWN